MFSKTCEYAIRACIFIAQKSRTGQKTGIEEIASGIDSPKSFIAKILQELTRHGLIQSAKGPGGGFYLDKQSLRYSLGDVVKAIDGDHIFSGCALGLDFCSETKPCPIHHEFKKVRKDLSDILQNAKLGHFYEQFDKNLSFLKQR
jgi:Rrf2 family protein